MGKNIICLGTLGMMVFCVIGLFVVHGFMQSKDRKSFFYCLSISTVTYACFVLSKHYSVDSFNLIFDPGAYWHMQLGRYLNCGELLLQELFHLHPVIHQQFFAVFWILSVAIAVCVINDAMVRAFKPDAMLMEFVILASTALSFINVFFMEFVLFPEIMGLNVFGVIALALAIWFALRRKKFWIRWGISFVFLMIALGNYQSYLGIYETFVLMGTFFLWKDYRKEKYINLLMVLLAGGGASFINVIFVKALVSSHILSDSGRGASLQLETILSNLRAILLYQKRFWLDADGFLPAGVMPVFGILLLAVICRVVYKIAFSEKVEYILIILMSAALGFAPHIIESRILLTPRSNLAIWSVIAVIMISGTPFVQKKLSGTVLTAAGALMLMLNVFVMQDMAANNQMVNAADFVEANQICDEIRKYEADTGKTIIKLAVGYDTEPTVYQPFSRYKNSELGARILVTSYSGYRLIGYELGRSLEKINIPDEIYNSYFAGKNWNCMNLQEQMQLEGDTAYLIIY